MRTTRHLPRQLRRARLLAAREYKSGTICWKGILSGHWDAGAVVRTYLTQPDQGSAQADHEFPAASSPSRSEPMTDQR